MDDALAHLGEDRLGAGKCARRAARHEGEGRRLRAADAARDRCVEGRKPALASPSHAPCARFRRRSSRNRSQARRRASPARMSLQTARTCLPAGNMVMTTSASATASRAEAATAMPSASACAHEAGTRSKPTTRCCALTRLAAMGPPMLPRPMKAMVVIARVRPSASVSPAHIARATMRRMISFVPSRIWCTRRSRTIFSMP